MASLDPNDPQFSQIAASMAQMFDQASKKTSEYTQDQIDNFKNAAGALTKIASQNVSDIVEENKGSIEKFVDAAYKSTQMATDKNIEAVSHMTKAISQKMKESADESDAYIKRLVASHQHLYRALNDSKTGLFQGKELIDKMHIQMQLLTSMGPGGAAASNVFRQALVQNNYGHVFPAATPTAATPTAAAPSPGGPPPHHGSYFAGGVPPVPGGGGGGKPSLTSLGPQILSILKKSASSTVREVAGGAGTAGEIAELIAKTLGPEGMVIGSAIVAGALALKTMTDLESKSGDIFRSVGTNRYEFESYEKMLPGLIAHTHMGMDEIVDMANAFNKAGVSVSTNTKNLDGYLTLATQAEKLLGISTETAAEYTKAMIDEGKSVEEVHDSFDHLWQTQQKLNLSVYDTQDAIAGSIKLFKEYGAVINQTQGDMAESQMKIIALYKAQGMSSADAAAAAERSRTSAVGNQSLTAVIASTLGGKDTFTSLGNATPEVLAAKRIQAEITEANLLSSGLLLQTSDQLKTGRFKNMTAQQIEGRKQSALVQAASMFSDDPTTMGRLFSGLSNQEKMNMQTPEGIAEHMKKTQEQQKATTSWDTALTNVNSQFGEVMKSLEHIGQALLITLGTPLMRMLQPFLTITEKILEIIVNMTGPLQPVFDVLDKLSPLTPVFNAIIGVLDMILEIQKRLALTQKWGEDTMRSMGLSGSSSAPSIGFGGIGDAVGKGLAFLHKEPSSVPLSLPTSGPASPFPIPPPATMGSPIPPPPASPILAVPTTSSPISPFPIPPPPAIPMPTVVTPNNVIDIAKYRGKSANAIIGAQVPKPPKMFPSVMDEYTMGAVAPGAIPPVTLPPTAALFPSANSISPGAQPGALASKLAETAHSIAAAANHVNSCAQYVGNAMQKTGLPAFREDDAVKMGIAMQKSGRFEKLPFDPKHMMTGDFLVREWADKIQAQPHGSDHKAGHNFGHIEIVTGAGKKGGLLGASDHMDSIGPDGDRYKNSYVLRLKQTELMQQICDHNAAQNASLAKIETHTGSQAHSTKIAAHQARLNGAGNADARNSTIAMVNNVP